MALRGISGEIAGPCKDMITIRRAMGRLLDILKKLPTSPAIETGLVAFQEALDHADEFVSEVLVTGMRRIDFVLENTDSVLASCLLHLSN